LCQSAEISQHAENEAVLLVFFCLDSGEIKSPNYPEHYYNHLLMEYRIAVNTTQVDSILIEFKDSYTEPEHDRIIVSLPISDILTQNPPISAWLSVQNLITTSQFKNSENILVLGESQYYRSQGLPTEAGQVTNYKKIAVSAVNGHI